METILDILSVKSNSKNVLNSYCISSDSNGNIIFFSSWNVFRKKVIFFLNSKAEIQPKNM